MPYSRCFSTLGCPDLDVRQALDLAHAHHLDAIELRSLEHRIDLPTYFAERYGSPAKMAAAVADHPVRIVSLDTSLKLFANDETDRADLLAFAPWADALGVPWLRIFDGGTSVEKEIKIAEDTLGWWRDQRSQHGWTMDLMVETHDSLLDAAAINLLEHTCPDTAILWDTHHTWKVGREDPVKTWSLIAPHVVHLHVKESISKPGPQHPFTYVMPGKGEFPMAPLRAAIGNDFSGMMSLEWERHWHPDLPALDTVLNAAATARWW
jgi:sugar phosphate isomerase/epimerase